MLSALKLTARSEGIVPALESAHALAGAFREMPDLPPQALVVINVSGRGDKDIFITAPRLDGEDWLAFLETEVAAIRNGERK